MSILSALKQQNSSIDDLAALPQAMIMQMAQKKQISEEMLAPILSRKAELAEAFARENALKGAGQMPPTVVEQLMAQNAQAEQPQMPPQMPPQAMPQMPEEAGVGQLPVPERQYAGGGIIAFADGGMSDDEDEDYEDALEEADYDKMIERAMNAGEDDYTPHQGVKHPHTSMGITAGHRTQHDSDLDARLRSAIISKESGGRRYDKNGNLLTSSKGAQGEMQVMPYTATDPGFGIKPAQSKNPDELRRVGDEYASAMLRRYRDPKLAMIAYNMGPGATDKWLSSGADPRKLPKETQGYIGGVNLAEGGEVRHFVNDGYVGYGTETPYDPDAPSIYDTFGSMLGSPLERLKSSIYGVGFTTEKEREQARKAKKTDKQKASPPPQNAQPSTSAYIPNANPNLDNRDVGLQEGIVNGFPTQAQETPKSRLDAYMDKMMAREDAMEKSRADDKNMALLTAGLGMLGGTSPYAMANIGQGALAGVQHLNESKKLRAAEQSAIDKSMLYATRYQGAEDIARQNALYNQGLQSARLEETKRANTNKEVEQAQSNLNNYVKIAQANLKDRFPAGEMDERYQAEMAKIYKSPEYIGLSKRAGLTIAAPTFSGYSAVPKQKN